MKSRLFGFEFECISLEDCNVIAENLASFGLPVDRYATGQTYCRNNCYSGWQVKRDGSITITRDYPHNIELVSPPIDVGGLSQVMTALKYMRGIAKVNSSCGLHVHVGTPELGNILHPSMRRWRDHIEKSWTSVEPIFFNYVPVSRRHGSYCHPGVDWGRKYSALNVSALSTGKNTIEFRLHSATLNYRKAVSFAMLCVSLVNKFINSMPTVIERIDPEVFVAPLPHLVETKRGKIYVHRTPQGWIIEHRQRTSLFPDLTEALQSLRHELGLASSSPPHAFRFPRWGNAMTTLCDLVELNRRVSFFLENRYADMTGKYGFVNSLSRESPEEDDESVYNEEELIVPSVPLGMNQAPASFTLPGGLVPQGQQPLYTATNSPLSGWTAISDDPFGSLGRRER